MEDTKKEPGPEMKEASLLGFDWPTVVVLLACSTVISLLITIGFHYMVVSKQLDNRKIFYVFDIERVVRENMDRKWTQEQNTERLNRIKAEVAKYDAPVFVKGTLFEVKNKNYRIIDVTDQILEEIAK